VGTAKTLEVTCEELRACESQLAEAKKKVERMDKERRKMQDQLFTFGR
jgi:exonuclease VII small subunit